MKKLIIPALIIFTFYSCGGSSEKTQKDSKEPEKEEKKEEVATKKDTLYLTPDYKKPLPDKLPKAERAMFKTFFTDSLSAELFALYYGYDSIQTERQMLIYYRALIAFKEKASSSLMDLNSSEKLYNMVMAELAKEEHAKEEDEYFDEYRIVLDYMLDKLAPADKYLHGISLSCVAECSEPSYTLVLNHLIGKAKETEGESDEKFMQLIIDNYTGEYEPSVMNAKWFRQTWDYGGMSLLGDGHHLAFMKATDKLLEEKNIFTEFINFYREDCFDDLAEWGSLAYDKAKIIAELKKITKEVTLDKEQKDALIIRQKEIESATGNKEDGSGIQLNCETGDCAFG